MTPSIKARYDKFADLVASGVPATEAAKQCGYSVKNAAQQGMRLSRNAYICERISGLQALMEAERAEKRGEAVERFAEAIASANEVLERLSRIAGDDKNRDQIRALELLGKHHKLFVDKLEVKDTSAESSVKKAAEGTLARLKLVPKSAA